MRTTIVFQRTALTVLLPLLLVITLACIATVAARSSRSSLAQTSSISCGQTLSGSISAVGEQDIYTFTGNQGEVVNIAAVATSGTLCARGDLYGPTGNLIAVNPFDCNGITGATLPATGTYTILVRDRFFNNTGTYNINLQFTTGRCATPITCGQTITISTPMMTAEQDAYNFTANAGEVVAIAAVSTSGALCARGDLYGPTGNLIAVNPFDCNGITGATLPATGTYTILVRDRFFNNTGTYNINLQFTTGRCGMVIDCGQTKSGTIQTAEQNAFIFCGIEGSSVSIAAVATSGTLCARGDLYGPTGNLIAVNPFDCNGITGATLPATGTYTILVRDRFFNNTGTYNINLTCIGSTCPTPTGLQYYPLPRPIRLFDTRAPIPGFAACAYLNQPLLAGQELARPAAGVTCDGITIPANAQAIVGNATVTGAAGAGFITLFPDGQPRPPVSNLNYVAGQTVPNAFTVGLGANGMFRTYAFAGTHFIVDVTGYFAPPGTGGLFYHPLPRPIRLFDTRAPIPGFAACEYLNQSLLGDSELARQARITCDGITIPADATAIVGNATVTGATGGGFITLFPDGQPRPPVSNLNYVTGQTVPNAFTVGLGANGMFRTYAFAGTHFIVDVTGYYSPSPSDANGTGLLYNPLPRPIRLFDTRAPIPGFAACAYLNQPLLDDGELVRQARITCDGITIPAAATAIVGNATVTGATGNGFITLYPNGQPRPPVSNLNYVTGQTVPNAFTVRLGADGQFRIYSSAGTHFITDLTGYFAP